MTIAEKKKNVAILKKTLTNQFVPDSAKEKAKQTIAKLEQEISVEEKRPAQKSSNKDKTLKTGDAVYNKTHKSVGIIREVFENDAKTDADGNQPLTDLVLYDPEKHKNAHIAPSTEKELRTKGILPKTGQPKPETTIQREIREKFSKLSDQVLITRLNGKPDFKADDEKFELARRIAASDGKLNVKRVNGDLKIIKSESDLPILDRMINAGSDVWDELGAESGADIRSSRIKLRKYAERMAEEMKKLKVKKHSLTENDYDALTDDNEHLLNEFLVWNGYFKTRIEETLQAMYVKTFDHSDKKNDMNAHTANPDVIALTGKEPGQATPGESLLEQIKKDPAFKDVDFGHTNLEIDAKRKALPRGKRKSADGNTYYESRENRSDRKQSGKIYLDSGGILDLNGAHQTFMAYQFAKGGTVDPARSKDYKYLNKSEDYEVNYASGKNRKSYLEHGGEIASPEVGQEYFNRRNGRTFKISEIAHGFVYTKYLDSDPDYQPGFGREITSGVYPESEFTDYVNSGTFRLKSDESFESGGEISGGPTADGGFENDKIKLTKEQVDAIDTYNSSGKYRGAKVKNMFNFTNSIGIGIGELNEYNFSKRKLKENEIYQKNITKNTYTLKEISQKNDVSINYVETQTAKGIKVNTKEFPDWDEAKVLNYTRKMLYVNPDYYIDMPKIAKEPEIKVNKKTGKPKQDKPGNARFTLAKKIRKPGQPWREALADADAQLKKK